MGGTVDNIQLAFIPPEETSDPNSKKFQTPLEYFEDRFENFDVTNAQCFDPLQKDRLLSVVEAGFGGLQGFNDALRETMKELKEKAALSLTSATWANSQG